MAKRTQFDNLLFKIFDKESAKAYYKLYNVETNEWSEKAVSYFEKTFPNVKGLNSFIDFYKQAVIDILAKENILVIDYYNPDDFINCMASKICKVYNIEYKYRSVESLFLIYFWDKYAQCEKKGFYEWQDSVGIFDNCRHVCIFEGTKEIYYKTEIGLARGVAERWGK